jgi:hypothetical protein
VLGSLHILESIRLAWIWKTPMDQREPNLVHSNLSRTVTKDGVTVEVSIVRQAK